MRGLFSRAPLQSGSALKGQGQVAGGRCCLSPHPVWGRSVVTGTLLLVLPTQPLDGRLPLAAHPSHARGALLPAASAWLRRAFARLLVSPPSLVGRGGRRNRLRLGMAANKGPTFAAKRRGTSPRAMHLSALKRGKQARRVGFLRRFFIRFFLPPPVLSGIVFW